MILDATCKGCSCACDDIELGVQENRIVKADRACPLGEEWFFERREERDESCFVDGKPTELGAAVDRAAQILTNACYPLIYGLSNSTCEVQRVAVGIADWIGGTVDTSSSATQGPSCVTFQGVGDVTCSLGEIANRADFVLFWNADPAETHPRHFSRYSLDPKGMFVPHGRSDRTAVLVDVKRTKSAEAMDSFLEIKQGADFEAIWTLRAIAKGLELDPVQVLSETGIELSEWQDLMNRMKAAQYGAVVFGSGLTQSAGEHLIAEAMRALVRDMNAFTRFVASPLRTPGNAVGADNVLTWRTGFPFGVDLSRGYPHFNPDEFSAEQLLSRGEVDAALIIGGDTLNYLSADARQRLRDIPCIAINSKELSPKDATVAFYTSTAGIHTGGTVYRMDGVPIGLRPALTSPRPSELDVLIALEAQILALQSTSAKQKSGLA